MVSYDGFTYTTNDPTFANSIAKGETEPYPYDLAVVKRYLTVYPKRRRTYIDVGAHIGITLAAYSRLFSTLIGFEPNPTTFNYLLKNVERNKIRCRTENVGLYSHECKCTIKCHGSNSGCYYVEPDANGTVECKTLDSYSFYDVDFIKIDTGGSELFVLKGAVETLRKYKPLVQVECNGLSETLYSVTTKDVVDFLADLGYLPYDTGSNNLFFYIPQIEPYQITCFWTGTTPMSLRRKQALMSMPQGSQCEIRLVTPEMLPSFFLQTDPVHPAYPYLSEVHKSDYLRTYIMHHYGGGYSDVKYTTHSWRASFDKLLASDAYILGYTELGRGGVAYSPVADAYAELIGNGAYICKPNTPLTRHWYREMVKLLDERLDELRARPAKHARDRKEDGTGYPIEWNELLGRIFHRVSYDHRDKIAHGLPIPLIGKY